MAAPISWTWRHAIIGSELRSTTKLVLLTLSCSMNDEGKGCYPTTKQLAQRCSLSERAVCEHLSHARDAGWIRVNKHGFAGQKWANHEYEPAWPDHEKGTDSDAEGTDPHSKGTDSDDKKALTEGQSSVSLIVSDNPPIVPPDRFDEFWSAYPKKVAKKEAREEWGKAVKSHSPCMIIEAAKVYALSVVGEDQHFTIHPQRWLKRERFLDDPKANSPPRTASSVLEDIRTKIDQHEQRKEAAPCQPQKQKLLAP